MFRTLQCENQLAHSTTKKHKGGQYLEGREGGGELK